jgi:hypothetical protein
MNLRSISAALRGINPSGTGSFRSKATGPNTAIYTGSNLNAFRKNLEQLQAIPALARFHKSAFDETSLFKRVGDELEFTEPEFRRLQGISLAVQNLVPALQETLIDLVGEEKDNTVYVRLPDSTDLKEVTDTMREFEKLLGQVVYHPKINGNIVLAGWEKGSLWMEILLGTTLAATVVAHVVKSAAIAYRRILDNKMISSQIDGLQAKAESMHDIKNGLKIHLEMLVDAEARQIYYSYYKSSDGPEDNEQIERLKHSVKTLAELMNKGAEVQPGLLLPPEIKSEFPDMKNLPALTSSIKELGAAPK